MERVSLIAHLSSLLFVLVADLAALPLLRWQLIRLGSKSELFRQSQTWVMILKCVLDSALVSLMALDTAKDIDDSKQSLVRYYIRYNDCLIRSGEQFELAVQLLLRFSIVCVSTSEACLLSEEYISATSNESQLLFTRQIFPGVNSRHLGW